ncbi:hypothetical protein NEMBOFW57_009421 [Staphylotrichum longicolle]|uniref:Uncharacterized protein n=1 Tax=Staphylotrichum longicolle TaxID=669026 RepID=A0AAD4HVF7_9PEZI|nr:hypothetical protein NEMBOFW57_009421 [Staphylotrichum longicolle]
MKYLTALASALGLLASASAIPLEERDAQTVHLTFHGGPAEYSLAIPADGVVYPTNNNIAVNIIDAPDYNAFYQCQFHHQGEATLASSISPAGVNQIMVGPPTPITGVSCQGMCVPTYSDCYRNGQYVGPCCSGFCAANKCRPWVSPY